MDQYGFCENTSSFTDEAHCCHVMTEGISTRNTEILKHLMDIGMELMETAEQLGMSDNIDFRFIDTTYAFIWN